MKVKREKLDKARTDFYKYAEKIREDLDITENQMVLVLYSGMVGYAMEIADKKFEELEDLIGFFTDILFNFIEFNKKNAIEQVGLEEISERILKIIKENEEEDED